MHRHVFAVLLALAVVTPAVAQEKKNHMMVAANDLSWSAGPPSLPKGAQFAVIEGNPAEEGIFTMRLKLPANYRIPPHWHPAFEHVTVLEGSFSMGTGEKFDDVMLHELRAGGFAVMHPGARHFAASKGGTTIQLHGMGPWQIFYVNPAEDPRQAATPPPPKK